MKTNELWSNDDEFNGGRMTWWLFFIEYRQTDNIYKMGKKGNYIDGITGFPLGSAK